MVNSPANVVGAADVTVTTLGGTSAKSAADQFTYTPVPAVTSLSQSGGAGGRRNVGDDHGHGPGQCTAVKFGNRAATSFVVNSATQITAVPRRARARWT